MILSLLFACLMGCSSMKTVTLQPAADIFQGWQQIPNDGQAHFLKVDEGFGSQDGDASYLFDTGGASFERLGFADLPPDLKTSSQVRVRGYAKAQDAGTTLGLAFFVDSIEYDALQGWDFSALPLNQWVPLDFIMGNFPVLHGGETIEVLLVSFAGVGQIRLGQLELVVDYFPHPERASGKPDSHAPAASISGGAAAASPSSGAPAAVASGSGPLAAGTSAAPGAVLARIVLSGDPASQAPLATLANLNDLRIVLTVSPAPRAIPASTAPAAVGSANGPKGDIE